MPTLTMFDQTNISLRMKYVDIAIYGTLGWSFVFFCIFDYHFGNFLKTNFIMAEVMLFAGFLIVILWALFKGQCKIDVLAFALSVAALSLTGGLIYDPFWSFVGSVFLLKSYMAYVFGIVVFKNPKFINSILQFIYVIGLISAFISIIGRFVDLSVLNSLLGVNTSRDGAIGIFDNSNKNAQFMLFSMAATLILSKKKLVRNLSIMLFVITLFLTGSRQSLLALVILSTFIITFHPEISKKRKFLLLSLFAFLTSLLIIFLGNILFSRFAEVSRILEGGAYFRLEALLISLQIFMENPVFGSGPGSFGGVVANLSNSSIHEKYNLFAHWIGHEKRPTTIDMFWPHFWAESGFFGLAIFFVFIYRVLRKLFRILKNNKNAVYLISFIFSLLFMGFFSFILESNFIGLVFFALCGGWVESKWIKTKNI